MDDGRIDNIISIHSHVTILCKEWIHLAQEALKPKLCQQHLKTIYKNCPKSLNMIFSKAPKYGHAQRER